MNADGVPDLVINGWHPTDNTVGNDKWLVYLGSASGFASTATNWALPPGYGDREFDKLADTGGVTHSTLDMNADGFPDLVINGWHPTDSTIGNDKWLVYLGGAAGFTSSTNWALPPGYDDREFDKLADTGGVTHGTLDMNADGVPDLVIVGWHPTDSSVGSVKWLVYTGQCQ